MIPANPPPLRTYYDPSLWDRLGPAIQQQQVEKAQHIIDGHWKALEEVREAIGYLRGLQWVMNMAADLTRVEDPKET